MYYKCTYFHHKYWLLGDKSLKIHLLSELAKKVIVTAKKTGLEINENKIKFMIIQKEFIPIDQNKYLQVEDYRFKRVHKFKYI